MSGYDLKNNIDVDTTLSPLTRTASETGATIDLKNYEGVAIEAINGTITDGVHSLTVEESDDSSTFTVVDTSHLQGSFSDLATDTNQEVGYIGNKRYLRVNVSVSSATSGGTYTVSIVKGMPKVSPI